MLLGYKVVELSLKLISLKMGSQGGKGWTSTIASLVTLSECIAIEMAWWDTRGYWGTRLATI